MYVPLSFKNKRGKRIKSFHLTGAPNIEKALLWIWREMFVTILAHGSERDEENISLMLQDISDILGWQSLGRIVTGGDYGGIVS